jgi:enoyl-CoA hydratase
MKYTFVTVKIEEGIAHVILERAPVNALNAELLQELHNAIGRVTMDKSVRVALVYGVGKNFAAGADIKEIKERAEDGPDEVREFSELGHRAFRAMEIAPIPFIACINGFCLGGGCELAMGADIRVADLTAKFGQPEIRLGIIPGFGATFRLAEKIGRGRALQLLLTGEMIDARRAYELGLVDVLAPEGKTALEHGLALAQAIAKFSVPVISAMKEAVGGNEPMNPEDAIKREAKIFGRCSELEDMMEGFSAFIEKREPKFKNR